MNEFFIILLLVGTLMVAAVLVLIAFDWKKYSDSTEILNEKVDRLQKLLDESELMINELNNLSDYITENIEKKISELNSALEQQSKAPYAIENSNTEHNSTVRQQEIAELLKAGLSDTEIAKRLKTGKGEVQLIMGINRGMT